MSLEQNVNRLMTSLSSLTPPVAALNDAIGAGIVSGTVTSINPLVIRIEGRKDVPEDFITLSPFCIRAEFDNFIPTEEREGGSGDYAFAAHTHEFHVGLWRGLQVGDEVTMLMSSDKQQYYCFSRVGMIFGDMGVPAVTKSLGDIINNNVNPEVEL